LGCGPRGNSQAGAWKQVPGAALVALCDLNRERLDAVGERHGVTARYTDLEEMFARETLDVVAVPARADWHFPLTQAVLEHGVSAVVEKPITLDLVQADRMVETARARGVRLAVHHQLSVGPIQRKAKALIAAGAIGELRAIRGAGKGYYGGFGVMETGTHILDQMRNFGGPVDWIQARVTVRGRDAQPGDVAQAPRGLGLVAGDTVTAYYAFQNGLYGIGEFFHRAKIDSRAYAVDLIGTEGMLCLRSGGGAGIYLQRDPVWHPVIGAPWEEVLLAEEDYRLPGTDHVSRNAEVWLAHEMAQALREDREHDCSGDAGRQVLEWIQAGYASHVAGARVSLPLAERRHPLALWCEQAGRPVPEFCVLTDAEFLAAEAERLGAREGSAR